MSPRFAGLIVAALTALSLAPAASAAPVTDASGRSVSVTDASRIVAIGGAVTEILYALGLEDRVIAVDATSTFPARAQAKPSVGYMRTLSAEGVLAASPSLVLAVEGSGPREAIEVLQKAAVPFVLVPEATDAAGVTDKIRFVANAVGEHARGEALAAAVESDLAALAKVTAAIAERRKAVFVLSMGGGSPMVAGRNTAADAVFALAGIDNALAQISGYKAATDEAAMAANPDAVVLMGERNTAASPEQVFATPAFAGTEAAKAQRLVVMSGAYLLAFGPRTAQAARDLAAAVYPELNLPALPPRPWTTGAE